jgi:hypothetical protein
MVYMDEVQFYQACQAAGIHTVTLGYQIKTQFWISRVMVNNTIHQSSGLVSSIPAARFYDRFCIGSADPLPPALLNMARLLSAMWHTSYVEKILTDTIHNIGVCVAKMDMTKDAAHITQLLDVCDIAKVQYDKITLKIAPIDWRVVCAGWQIEGGQIPQMMRSDSLRFRHIIQALTQLKAGPGVLYVTCDTIDLLHENTRRTLSIAEDRYGHYSTANQQCFVFTFCNTHGDVSPAVYLIARELGGQLAHTGNRHTLSIVSSAPIGSPRCAKHQEKKQHIALCIDDAVLSAAAYKMLVHMGYSNVTIGPPRVGHLCAGQLIITNTPDYPGALVIHDMENFEELVIKYSMQRDAQC